LFCKADYDLKKSTTIVTCAKKQRYSSQQIESLVTFLTFDEENSQDDQILVNFYKKALCYIEENFEKTSKSSQSTSSNTKTKTSVVDVESNENENSKKAPMKTAGDVRRRIQWDENINKEHITVGYLDRFLGIKECKFGAFDWGDIVLADMGALAIPEHRINYFKYKNEIIWDKNTRIDNVYGSTGSNITIYEVIERLGDATSNPADIQLEDYEESEEVHKLGRAKTTKLPPNYFVSIPIENRELIQNLANFTNEILDANKFIEEFLVPSTSYHLTLCTLRIESPEELELAKVCLAETLSNYFEFVKEEDKSKSIKLKFEGIGEFFNKTFFVKCLSEQLTEVENLKKLILDNFGSKKLNTTGNYYDFVPHLTIFKIKSRPTNSLTFDISSSKKSSQNNTQFSTVRSVVDESLWQKYQSFNFGEVFLEKIDLCKMCNIFNMKNYPVEFSIDFKQNS
jgi:2'-5' RNA ligase/uncharacterized protein (UPF0248 family)